MARNCDAGTMGPRGGKGPACKSAPDYIERCAYRCGWSIRRCSWHCLGMAVIRWDHEKKCPKAAAQADAAGAEIEHAERLPTSGSRKEG